MKLAPGLNPHAKEWTPSPFAAGASTPPWNVPTDTTTAIRSGSARPCAVVDRNASSSGSPTRGLSTRSRDGDLTFDDLFDSNEHGAVLHAPAAPVESPCAPSQSMAQPSGSEEGESSTVPRNTPVKGHTDQRTAAVAEASAKLGPNDFECLHVVGQGAFGKVFQVRKRDTGAIYAMKVMRKDKILAKDHGGYIRAERDVLTAVFHPYIVTLRYSFQTNAKLYLVLDFINGGHLFFNLYRQGIFDEAQARLYTAEIVLAISHLHSLGIVHRDLKPENLLLDADGHIKITDFGLAKANMSDDSRTNSFIGTMEYMAPEIIAGKSHGKAVDWWSTGILLFEMLCGVTPYRAKSKDQLKKMITGQKLKFTAKVDGYLTAEAKSLVRALLEKDPAKRLGSGADGSAAVMRHAFFRKINWKWLQQREIASPFRPKISGEADIQNFDRLWTDCTPEDSPGGTPNKFGSLEPDDSMFEGFTYVAPSFLAELHRRMSLTRSPST